MPFRPHPTLTNAVDDGDPSSDFEDDSHATLKQQLDLPQQDGAKIDHRKKRRNRTTQSCLSCHQNKRKCDRGRPCGRCITLGLTGFCVYEVGEKTRDKDSDEVTQLRNRVAELEGVVRELKNKPQPRWAANAIVAPSTASSDSQQPPVAPSTPAPTISFPKESWHVRSARKDMAAAAMDRENDGVSLSHDKKKRKLADTSFDDDNSTYHVKMEVAPSTTTTFPRDANENDGSWLHDDGTTMNVVDGAVALGVGHDISLASTLVLGSPLFADVLLPSFSPSPKSHASPITPTFRRSSHPNIPLGTNSTSSNNGRFGLGITNPNINGSGISTTYGNVPFMQDPSLGSLAGRRSLTGPPPTISSLSRRNVTNLSSSNSSNGNHTSPASSIGSSKLGKQTTGSILGGKQQTGPPCACLADPTATQFVAHLTRNVRSTVEFLETRHRASPSNGAGDDDGQQRSPVEDPLVKTVHECGVMRALTQLDKSIRLSSGSTKRAARFQKQQQPPQQSSPLQPHQEQTQPISLSPHSHHLQHHLQANIPIPAPLTPPAHLRFLDTDPNEVSDSESQSQQRHYQHRPTSTIGHRRGSSAGTTTAVGSGRSESSSPHSLSVHDNDSADVDNTSGNGRGNNLDGLELMEMEMMNAPSPVNLLSEEALHALSSPSHSHSHSQASHAHSNVLPLSHHHLQQMSHDHYHHHPLSSERDSGGNSNGGGAWGEHQHPEHDGEDGGGGAHSGVGPNSSVNNGVGGSPLQHRQQHQPPSSTSFFGPFDNYDFLSQSEELFRS